MSISADIIIPAYNPGRYLEEALISALLQTYEGPYTITVIDDGSTEDLLVPFEKIKARYGRPSVQMQLLKLRDNRGVSCARNTGIKQSCGEILLFHDADDIMHERRLASSLEQFLQDPFLMLVCGNSQWIVDGVLLPMQKEGKQEINRETLLLNCPIASSSVAVRKSSLQVTGLFNESYEVAEDYDLWLRFLRYFPNQMKHIPELWYYYRRNTQEMSLTSRYAGTPRLLEILIEMMKEHGNGE